MCNSGFSDRKKGGEPEGKRSGIGSPDGEELGKIQTKRSSKKA